MSVAEAIRLLAQRASASVVGALPVAWLPRLARCLAPCRLLRARAGRIALANLALALGARPQGEARRLVREAGTLHLDARLRATHPRDATVARLRSELADSPWRKDRPRPLLLLSHLGGPALARAALRTDCGPCADLDALPRHGEDAAWIPWLGRMTVVDLAPLRGALDARRGVRLLLVLPEGPGWRPWWSPDLTAGAADAPVVAERALRVLEVLVRAAPHLWDWTWPRWALRPEREALGHAPSSRLAPWLNPRRRGGRRARRGR